METYKHDIRASLLRIYDRCILGHPVLTLVVTFGVLVFFAFQAPKFHLDASGKELSSNVRVCDLAEIVAEAMVTE